MPVQRFPLPSSNAPIDPSAASAHRDYQRQRQMTLGDLLLENRIILLQGEIYDGNANELVMKLLYLQSENRRKDIHFYINSPGGSVTATMAIYDTMQFVKPEYRQTMINKIYKSLNWGGAFIMFEKIRASDARFQDMYSIIYNDFKLKNGFTPSEIVHKTRSLKGILEPFSDYGNCSLLKRAGFVDYITVFQWMSFKGYLCIK